MTGASTANTPNIAAWAILLMLLGGIHGQALAETPARPDAHSANRGTADRPIIDSGRSLASERQLAIARGFPPAVVNRQALVDVDYLAFDGKVHRGQLMIDARLANDIKVVFRKMAEIGFPIAAAVPISKFGWDDTRSMAANNTSGFNYRKIKGKNEWSNHAFGQAIDINPVQNPYVNGRHRSPKGANYNPAAPGTFVKNSPLVKLFNELGWTWGGDWTNMKDYQHFEKVLR
ncbi:M15 family metallopeptidase [uncultured Thiodictyon sp.]|uniref:M15 family metallopeptidase n=1 Tax=uncultured Thiodictyon sp. TaxID=1846217 RepID=UPI0025E26A64|nr:M15 family metallopeptidase [uncultured Thiodictyon sp.]